MTIRNGQATTTTLEIAAGTGVGHRGLMAMVRKYRADLERFGLVQFEISPRLAGQHGGGDAEIAILGNPMRIAVVNTKGGVGKTTVAVHLAAMLAEQAPTLLIDADPQASAASWAAWRREANREPSPTTTCLVGKAVFDEGRNLAAGFAHTVIDAGGRDSSSLRGALLLAERAVVPVGASNFDAAALTDLLEIVDLARDFNRGLDVRVLLMRVDPRTKDAGDMLAFLKEHQLNVLNTRICERVAFRRASGDGATVAEVGKDQAAIQEMQSFFNEVTA